MPLTQQCHRIGTAPSVSALQCLHVTLTAAASLCVYVHCAQVTSAELPPDFVAKVLREVEEEACTQALELSTQVRASAAQQHSSSTATTPLTISLPAAAHTGITA